MIVKVGIFWVIDGKVYASISKINRECINERARQTGRIDSDFNHYVQWDKICASEFPDADFATYPRGRVMYDVVQEMHIVFADMCVGVEAIEEIRKMYDITRFTIERDEHYRCDKCMSKIGLPKLYVEDCGDSYRVEVISNFGVVKRTLEKGVNDEFAFEDILNEVNVFEDSDGVVCKFMVDEIPPSQFSLFFSDNTGITPIYIVGDKIRYKVTDGENKIGANLIEIFYNNTKVLIECGRELEPTEEGTILREKTVKKHYDACFISHYHADHAGLLSAPINCDKIYMGEYTLKILEAIGGICRDNIEKTITFNADSEIDLDGLIITPLLCDHSAYDSYMLLFKSQKNSILYTGDFRASGRKSFETLLEKLPQEVDTIICEGTNLKRKMPVLTENELECKLADILCNTDKPIFVLQSATNIDRIVSVYRATIRSNRTFIMRLVQADICSLLPNIPQPNGFKKCYVYPEFSMTDENHKAYENKYGKRLIGREHISQMQGYVLEVTSRDLGYIQKLNEKSDLRGAKLIYSTWGGYKKREEMKVFLEGLEAIGIETIDLHASGHADSRAIGNLLKRVKYTKCQFIHKD